MTWLLECNPPIVVAAAAAAAATPKTQDLDQDHKQDQTNTMLVFNADSNVDIADFDIAQNNYDPNSDLMEILANAPLLTTTHTEGKQITSFSKDKHLIHADKPFVIVPNDDWIQEQTIPTAHETLCDQHHNNLEELDYFHSERGRERVILNIS